MPTTAIDRARVPAIVPIRFIDQAPLSVNITKLIFPFSPNGRLVVKRPFENRATFLGFCGKTPPTRLLAGQRISRDIKKETLSAPPSKCFDPLFMSIEND
ncbi:MAG TPA: hypothetical protein DD435_00980 [Cyanobacteria bacterium UBA8530]|nr:hypothetical protein [Cyanobacteria bacterium UBA8530]